jgi:hypothetical protein
MKTLIAAALLLALIGPAQAFDFTKHCDTHGCDATAERYQEGMRDYREGQCYRARPYADHSPEQELWIKGYYAQRKQHKRDMSHCFR